MADVYYRIGQAGGNDLPLMVWPPRSLEQVRELYPAALSIVALQRNDWLALCERMEPLKRSA